jgi:F0F1-type ATP synthase gamma subunit
LPSPCDEGGKQRAQPNPRHRIGNKGLGFMQRMGAKVVSHVTQLGDTPHLEKLIGP